VFVIGSSLETGTNGGFPTKNLVLLTEYAIVLKSNSKGKTVFSKVQQKQQTRSYKATRVSVLYMYTEA